jgi:uncharacterized protein YqeY
MSIKASIQAAFVTAMKEKNEVAKITLSGLKAKITEQEKANKNQELTDAEVIKVLTTAVKQRKESADAFTSGNRPELAAKELAEMAVIETFLPAQMTDAEIEAAVRTIIHSFAGQDLQSNVLRGKTMGAFNKQYTGQANPESVKTVINNIIL